MKYKQIRLGPKFIFMMISVMMPLWIYLEEGFFLDDVDVTIPYFDILKSLFMFVVPLFIGESMPKYLLQHTASHMQKIHLAFLVHVDRLLTIDFFVTLPGIIFRRFKEQGAEFVGRLIKPFSFIFLVFMITFGLYTNRYVFSILGAYPFLLIPALLQPYLGFGIGFLIASTLGRQPRYRAVTIAIETGIQNIAIPMTLLQNSFEQPLGDVAATMPVTTALFTPLPLMATFVFLFIRKRLCPPKPADDEEHEGGDDVKSQDELNRYAVEPLVREVPADPVNGGPADATALMSSVGADDFSRKYDDFNRKYDEFTKKFEAFEKESVI